MGDVLSGKDGTVRQQRDTPHVIHSCTGDLDSTEDLPRSQLSGICLFESDKAEMFFFTAGGVGGEAASGESDLFRPVENSPQLIV